MLTIIIIIINSDGSSSKETRYSIFMSQRKSERFLTWNGEEKDIPLDITSFSRFFCLFGLYGWR